ncbi:MAG: hypothetical protein ACTSP5_13565 [Candidatus Heimdallarchaeota archaeon]
MSSPKREKTKEETPDQEEFGHCYCGLYTTKEFKESEKMPDGIPERRPEEKWI